MSATIAGAFNLWLLVAYIIPIKLNAEFKTQKEAASAVLCRILLFCGYFSNAHMHLGNAEGGKTQRGRKVPPMLGVLCCTQFSNEKPKPEFGSIPQGSLLQSSAKVSLPKQPVGQVPGKGIFAALSR